MSGMGWQIVENFMLFSDPFYCNSESAPTNLQSELIKLEESSDLKSLQDLPLNKFYFLVPASTYSNLHKLASRMAFLFGSTYICEKTFSIINFNKSKWKAGLSDEYPQSILQISTTQYLSSCSKLNGEKSQLHISH